MLSEPRIVERQAQHYAAVRRTIGMNDVTKAAGDMSGKFFAWLGKHGIAVAGAPFFKYDSFSEDGKMVLEWRAPVPLGVAGDELVRTSTLPAGRYVTAMHTGPFPGLREATRTILEWVEDNGLELDRETSRGVESFACRLELYHTDPRAEPDSHKWTTEITMRLADET
jgi:effector-binding domain-containing protein